jgi:hypothetical protein
MNCDNCDREIEVDVIDCPYCGAFFCECCEKMKIDGTDDGDNICLECQTERAISKAEAYQDMMN